MSRIKLDNIDKEENNECTCNNINVSEEAINLIEAMKNCSKEDVWIMLQSAPKNIVREIFEMTHLLLDEKSYDFGEF